MVAIEQQHVPVLLDEVLQGLRLRSHGSYVDCTYGRGGHSRAILQRLGPRGCLYAFDKDPAAIARAQAEFGADPRFFAVRGSFTRLQAELESRGISTGVDGVLLDLGVSSPQLDDARYGFSFQRDGALDMRLDPDAGGSAADWLNFAAEAEIAHVLREYGEERYARRIAAAIVKSRAAAPVVRTRQLAEIIAAAVPTRERSKDPATRSFLAIRIFINRELDELNAVLPQAVAVLNAGGRLVVISFHSLEDRIVKRFMRAAARGDDYPSHIPVTSSQLRPQLRLISGSQRAADAEVDANPRARSAVLRVAEKLPA